MIRMNIKGLRWIQNSKFNYPEKASTNLNLKSLSFIKKLFHEIRSWCEKCISKLNLIKCKLIKLWTIWILILKKISTWRKIKQIHGWENNKRNEGMRAEIMSNSGKQPLGTILESKRPWNVHIRMHSMAVYFLE